MIDLQGKNRNMADARAQAGIISGDGRHLSFRATGTDQIRNLDSWSNVNEEGVLVFKVGPMKEKEENVGEPDVDLDERELGGLAGSCSTF
jgi:hypothetical protein